MIDRAAIFADVLRRQALRQQALLPKLDIRAEYDRAVARSLLDAYRHLIDQHGDQRAAFEALAQAEFEAEYPTLPPRGWASRVVVKRKVLAWMRAFVADRYQLAEVGNLAVHPVVYGRG